MYKAIHSKKLYGAVEKFPKARKTLLPTKVYKSGIRVFDTDLMKTYSLVMGCFRIMVGFKHNDREM